jgi:hypothetical protein
MTREICPQCDGDGDGPSWQQLNCPRCGGSGRVKNSQQGPDAPPFIDTSVKAAIRQAFDSPTVANIERVATVALEAAEQQVAALQEWKDAVIDAAVVDWIYTKEHETNPRKAVNDLLAWQAKLALDPAVSKEAHDLHEQIAALRRRP